MFLKIWVSWKKIKNALWDTLLRYNIKNENRCHHTESLYQFIITCIIFYQLLLLLIMLILLSLKSINCIFNIIAPNFKRRLNLTLTCLSIGVLLWQYFSTKTLIWENVMDTRSHCAGGEFSKLHHRVSKYRYTCRNQDKAWMCHVHHHNHKITILSTIWYGISHVWFETVGLSYPICTM